jgi:hypothetical protein
MGRLQGGKLGLKRPWLGGKRKKVIKYMNFTLVFKNLK